MYYIKVKKINSFTLQNTNNNSLAEFTIFAQPIVRPRNRHIIAIELSTKLISHSEITFKNDNFFNDKSDELTKSLITIQIDELNNSKFKRIIKNKNIISSIKIPFRLLSEVDFISSIIKDNELKLAFEITAFNKKTRITPEIKTSISIINKSNHELWLDGFMSENMPYNILHLLKWDRIKIDQMFTYKYISNDNKISSLFNYLSNFSFKSIIFKGIESNYQNDQLLAFKCLCQGYLYSKPRRL